MHIWKNLRDAVAIGAAACFIVACAALVWSARDQQAAQQNDTRQPAQEKRDIGTPNNGGQNVTRDGKADERDLIGFWDVKWTDIVIAIFTGLLFWIALRQTKHFERSERPFVKMSHVEPGAVMDEVGGTASIQLHIKNCGRTPADVIGIYLGNVIVPKGSSLPSSPPYARNKSRRGQAFLVADDEIWLPAKFPIAAPELASIRSGAAQLYIFGYVDYRDRLTGGVQRSGYGRLYSPESNPKNNLVFIDAPGYIYDRPRLRGEVHDWDDTE